MSGNKVDLGFGVPKKTGIDLSGFEPKKNSDKNHTDLHEDVIADRAAEKAGFVSREPVERVERVRKSKEVQDTAYIRGPISVINRFKKFCNDSELTHGEAIDELMKKAGI